MKEQIDPNTIRNILRVLNRKIARRSSDDYAVSLLSDNMKKLREKYDFLKYISINQSLYTEEETILIAPELTSIDEDILFSAINDLMKLCVADMKEKADFFFIREFQEAFEEVDPVHHTVEVDESLNQMQHDYIIRRTQSLDIQKDAIFADLIKSLLHTVNKKIPEKESVDLLRTSLVKLNTKYKFLSKIYITSDPTKKGYYIVDIRSDIREIPTYEIAEALESIIQDTGDALHIQESSLFLNTLRNHLGPSNVASLRNLRVNIDSLHFRLTTLNNEDALRKIIDALIEVIGNRTSKMFSLAVMKKIIFAIQQNNNLLDGMNLTSESGFYEITWQQHFESLSDEDCKKIIKQLVQAVGSHLGAKRSGFIQDLKKALGKEYVECIEKLGFNFHMMEIKFD
jgi:hypothetical protein